MGEQYDDLLEKYDARGHLLAAIEGRLTVEQSARAEAERRAERAEAACAAMREALDDVAGHRASNDCDSSCINEMADAANAALSSDAGAAMLAELERLRKALIAVGSEADSFRASDEYEYEYEDAIEALGRIESMCRAALTPAPAAEAANVCGRRCDHGSECLRMAHDDGRHETQHGCVFYDAPATGKDRDNG